MKGTITRCAMENVIDQLGKERGELMWSKAMEKAGAARIDACSILGDCDDAKALILLEEAGRSLGMSMEEYNNEFGEHWCCKYAPMYYRVFYVKYTTMPDFVAGLTSIHEYIARDVPGSRPPRFKVRTDYPVGVTGKPDQDGNKPRPKRQVIHYESDRNLIGLCVGLARGLAVHFGEDVEIYANGNVVTVEYRDDPRSE